MGKFYDPNDSFWPLIGKYVCVKDIYGRTHRGRLIDVDRADDNESGEDSIGVITHPKVKCGSDINRSEIVSIEILERDEITDDIRLDIV